MKMGDLGTKNEFVVILENGTASKRVDTFKKKDFRFTAQKYFSISYFILVDIRDFVICFKKIIARQWVKYWRIWRIKNL